MMLCDYYGDSASNSHGKPNGEGRTSEELAGQETTATDSTETRTGSTGTRTENEGNALYYDAYTARRKRMHIARFSPAPHDLELLLANSEVLTRTRSRLDYVCD